MGVSVLSSMAPRALLAELAEAWGGDAGLEAAGGVEVARRVRDGETADVVVLAADAMRRLESEGLLLAGSLVGVAVSDIAAAVRAGETVPDWQDGEGVRRAVLAAGRTGYSAGPSGDHLLRLLETWGIREALGARLVRARPGIPVGRLLAAGEVDLAFQQRSELLGIEGILIAGPLPPEVQQQTVFTAGLGLGAAADARRFIAFLAGPGAAAAKRRHGMEPV